MSTASPLGDPRTDDLALGRLLATAHQHVRGELNAALGTLGIEARHFGVLSALERHGPASQRRLIELLGLDKSAMVRIMDELEHLGLAARHRDEHDRRAYAVALTPEGEWQVRAAQEAASALGAEIFGWLRPADRERLVALLSRIAGGDPG